LLSRERQQFPFLDNGNHRLLVVGEGKAIGTIAGMGLKIMLIVQRLSALLIACCVIVAVVAQSLHLSAPISAQNIAQDNVQHGVCSDALQFIQQTKTPYDWNESESVNGEQLRSGITDVQFPAERYIDLWALVVNRADPTNPTTITINFPAVDDHLSLEFALYDGMVALIPYQSVRVDTPQQINVSRDGVFTFIVRRTHPTDQQDGNYQINAQFESGNIPIPAILRDQTINAPQSSPPFIIGGQQIVQVNNTAFHTHVRGVSSVGSHQGNASQVFFDSANSFLVNRWAQTVYLLGGDLMARGDVNGRERLLFVQDYNHAISQLDGELMAITDGNGTQWRMDWNIIDALWIGTDCAAFKLSDGRLFATYFPPNTNRMLQLGGNYQDFRVRVNNAELTLSWDGIISPVTTWYNNMFHTIYENDHQLSVTDSRLDVRYQPERTLSAIQLHTQNTRIITDWRDIQALRFNRENVTIRFNDGIRTETARPADGLRLFEALDGVTRIDYDPTPDNPIDEIMLLPVSDSLIEIITPAYSPRFDGRALPDEIGYHARGLNNTGAECYPLNSLIDSAQCPPNGTLNPANGNLFYAVTDLIAYGALDLTLTRSYNSATYQIDSVFGKGWSTPFRLDYQVAYDDVRNSRPITPEASQAFPVGLDLTFAPQGIVTFYTPSGSRHTFIGQAPFVSGTMTAITQPHWTLNRPDYRAGWTLTQSDGMTYQFDRAGRLKQYGYTEHDAITIDYQGNYLNGTADLKQTVSISDPSQQRHLELTFSNHQITQSELIGVDEQTHTTRYIYQNDLLTEVYYHDGSVAYYSYDLDGRLTHFNDPRAPFSREMFAEYGDDGAVTWYQPDQSIWQSLSIPIIQDDTVTRTLIDATTYPQTFTYAYHVGTLRMGLDNFTLLRQTTRITHPDDAESVPITYTWKNGLLTSAPHRYLSENVGRNTLNYDYNSAGYLTRIRGAHPSLTITYAPDNPRLPRQIDYPDETTEQFTYNEAGLLSRYQDRNGADYQLHYNERGQLIEVHDMRSNTRAIYTYNELGLIASSIPSALNGHDVPEAITYQYDSFGNLTQLVDPLLGTSTIRYDYNPDGVTVTLTDALGAQTISDFDHQSRLIRQHIVYEEQTLRDVLYTYDALGRLTTHVQIIDDEQSAQTTYTYEPLEELAPFDSDSERAYINGTRVTISDPAGRITEFIYDGRERLRLYSQPSGYVERYDYEVTDNPSELPNGLIIRERRAFNQRVFDENVYRFDLAWQLRSVITDTVRWDISTDGRFLPRVITPTPRNLFNSIQWAGYTAGQADGVRINQALTNLNTPNTTLNKHFDHHGRPTTLTIGDSTHYVAYCPRPDGGLETLYGYDALNCDLPETNRIYATHHDSAGRLTAVTTPTGTRTYDYQIAEGEWLISVDFNGASWMMTVNAVGDITEWVNHDGVRRVYQYDRMSRLIRVETYAPEQIAEASFTYTYNLIDQVTLAVDDVGHGLRYDYDLLGRLIVAQDTRNANATIYGYNADGLLASIISPLGNTTTILYQDDDPRRVTGVVTPTGANLRFVWSDTENALTFIDPQDQDTRYRFDGYGTLWQVEDALSRLHNIYYDPSGRLSSWRLSEEAESSAYQFDFAYPAPNQWQITSPDTPFTRTFTHDAGAITHISTGTHDLSLEYDALGRLVNALDRDGRNWALNWASGAVTFAYPDGDTQTLTYDALHRLVSDEGQTIAYTIPRLGEIQTTLTALDSSPIIITSTQGDAITRPPSTQVRRAGTLITTTRTPEGLLDEISFEGCIDGVVLAENGLDACLRGEQVWRLSERVTYDPTGRPIRIVDANQNVETFAYDESGNLIVYQDSDGQSFNYSYDALNRLTSLTSPTGTRLLLDYNAQDQVIGICRARTEIASTYAECAVDPSRIQQLYTYDSLGRLIEHQNGTIRTPYAYDADGGGLEAVGGMRFLYDALGLPKSILLDDRTIDLTILPTAYRLNLTELDGDAIRYDRLNRPIQIMLDGLTLSVDYAETGYTLTFDNGQLLDVTLDERGLLTALMADETFGATFDTFLSPDGRVQLTDVLRTDGQLVQTQRDRLGQVQNNAYFDSNLLVDNTLTAGGLLQRQSIIGAGHYFLPNTQDYIIVMGYDNDSRPITMRISDRENGQRIYLLTFTYDTLGRRQTETRQFRDDVTVTISYAYNVDNQLIQRTIQSGRQSYPIAYRYDERGNLTAISDPIETCRTYDYDSANRLTRVGLGDSEVLIAYDALNRPAQIGDKRLIYLGSSHQVIALSQDGTITWHIDGLMQAGDETTWLTHDGRGNIISATQDGDNAELWLFDPLKRFISLTMPIHAFTCAGMNIPEGLTALSPIINQENGTIWDMEIGLYLDGHGRAYAPELGVYLQQSPAPLPFSTAYHATTAVEPLPIIRQDTAYLQGLVDLEALLSDHTPLTASMILSQHLPTLPHGIFDGDIIGIIQATTNQQQAKMEQLLNFPAHVHQNYNLPSASRDGLGMLRLPTMNAPAHHTELVYQAGSALPDYVGNILPTLAPTHQSINARSPQAIMNHRPLTFYHSTLWQPTRPNGTITQNAPQTPYPIIRPASIREWLPAPLTAPQDAGDLLRTLVHLRDLPHLTLADWLMDALSVHLPASVSLPPADLQEWRDQYFNPNTLGLPDAHWPTLPAFELPSIETGFER
jgi:YD repeat-containing protein